MKPTNNTRWSDLDANKFELTNQKTTGKEYSSKFALASPFRNGPICFWRLFDGTFLLKRKKKEFELTASFT